MSAIGSVAGIAYEMEPNGRNGVVSCRSFPALRHSILRPKPNARTIQSVVQARRSRTGSQARAADDHPTDRRRSGADSRVGGSASALSNSCRLQPSHSHRSQRRNLLPKDIQLHH